MAHPAAFDYVAYRNEPGRKAAYKAVGRARHLGELVRQPCEVCGNPKTDAHHDDYRKPLKVRWLCRPHHRAHHLKHGPAKGAKG